MVDLITLALILLVIGAAVRYIVKEKKKGVHCIGCPSAGSCSHASKGGCGGGCSGNCGK